jgi:hypothetical protein
MLRTLFIIEIIFIRILWSRGLFLVLPNIGIALPFRDSNLTLGRQRLKPRSWGAAQAARVELVPFQVLSDNTSLNLN